MIRDHCCSRGTVSGSDFRVRDRHLPLELFEVDLAPDYHDARPVADSVLEVLQGPSIVRTANAAGDARRTGAGEGKEERSWVSTGG